MNFLKRYLNKRKAEQQEAEKIEAVQAAKWEILELDSEIRKQEAIVSELKRKIAETDEIIEKRNKEIADLEMEVLIFKTAYNIE